MVQIIKFLIFNISVSCLFSLVYKLISKVMKLAWAYIFQSFLLISTIFNKSPYLIHSGE